MNLSRKRRRELRRLRNEAQELLDQQRVVLGQANEVLHSAGRQAKSLSDEHLQPRINAAVDAARPTVDRGVDYARRSAKNVRSFTTPLVTAALLRTIRTLDDLEGHDAAQQVRGFGERSGYLKPEKKKRGGIIALVIGLVTATGVGYAIWQAFRTDDELWVSPES
ncbi:MAG: DNA/RNA helicase [Leucobacter sp.]